MVETATAQRLPVRFAGEGSGVEDLTWGQWAAWGSMQISGEADWAGGTMPLTDGQTVEEITRLLAFIMSRHQSLRTRLRLDADGTPRQELSASGEVHLEVVDAGGRDPAEVAEEVRERYETAPFDVEHDWPVRMAVVCRDGVAAHFVAIYSHLAIDGYGIAALAADLANFDRATGRHLTPVAALQPFELVRQQRSRAALRQQAMSLRHWERHLRTVTPHRFRPVAVRSEPRYWEASYRSPALFLALDVVAGRAKVHSGAVLLAAYAIMLSRMSGDPRSVVRTLVSNRFRPGFQESVAGVAQSALCVVDTAGADFDEVVARAWKSQLSAGMHAYYDPRELWALIDRVAAERGAEFDLTCYFNDRRRSLSQSSDRVTVTSVELSSALRESRLRWGRKSNTPDVTCFLHVNPVPDTIDLTLRVDTDYVSPDDLANCLRGIEELVVGAAWPDRLA
ncbi:hypothetical protein GCM10010399_35840 [Dactylosporangium fulvum]|uniref:Condensation domain-containing protein n=1 Tax=Dactylosporangium fulvum TaxID=53359 RepID=A0ABY5W6P0_9ACTN|nr:condensation domain-containing protein [Dactylosporangium fulvum]UWP84996.1 condensation domain-containing protein [Dactylosporangium fulvum]